MPDITMCKYEECPIKNKCHRYTAKPWALGQSYFAEPPYQIVKYDGKEYFSCNMFWGENAEAIYQQLIEITGGLDNLRGA